MASNGQIPSSWLGPVPGSNAGLLKPAALAYFAGFFDADGSVRIHRYREGRAHQLHVRVYNTTRPVLDAFKEQFGGSISTSANGPRARPLHRWMIGDRMAEAFLIAVEPHLIVKAERVRLALRFRALADAGVNRHQPAPEHVVEARERFCREMAELNKRGYG